eukprot:14558743-Ditylum_brightwellii.AAC.1
MDFPPSISDMKQELGRAGHSFDRTEGSNQPISDVCGNVIVIGHSRNKEQNHGIMWGQQNYRKVYMAING